jgi:type I restriction enzyme R subunit
MQTIARVNRRSPGKTAGVIVDYVGVFQNLQKALAIYAGAAGDDTPIKDKEALVAVLEEALVAAAALAKPLDIDVDAIAEAKDLGRLALIAKAVEILIGPDERRREFLRLAGAVVRAYRALLPDEKAAPYLRRVAVLHVLADAVKAKLGPTDISAIADRIAALIDEKLEGVAILTPIVEGDGAAGRVDLSGIDFDKLAGLFGSSPKTAAEQLRDAAEKKAGEMARRNPTRSGLVEKLEKLVDDYNAGSIDAESFFAALKSFVAEMDEAEQRAVREELTEDEPAIFDLLTKPEPALTKAEEAQVKLAAKQLLQRLQDLTAAIDWVRGQQTRGAVYSEIRTALDHHLPMSPYPEVMLLSKIEAVWDFVLQRYFVVPTGPSPCCSIDGESRNDGPRQDTGRHRGHGLRYPLLVLSP